MDNAIIAENVHISYKSFKTIPKTSKLSVRKKTLVAFEAVRGVSFTIKEGTIVGLVGKNGSGKSTLLRAVAGIFSPDEGNIDIGRRKVALLSLGIGFQTKLSGRENIILSGLLMGFSRKEIQRKMDDIIEFSELGEYIDMPVQSYSSGMFSRLAFSITSTLDSDIVLVDEVLSVGDERFKAKSLDRMKQLISDDKRTVMIVSHSMSVISEICDEVIWIDQGEILMRGSVEEVVPAYSEFMKKNKGQNKGQKLK